MIKAQLASVNISGKSVAFFRPPHDEPDFPWVDAHQLISAFLPALAAEAMLKSTQRFDDGKAVKTIISEGRLTTIMCHAMAQGLCGAIDEMHGHKGDEGPAFRLYCRHAASVAIDFWPMDIGQMVKAFHNAGGPFMRDEGGTDA